MSRLDQFIERLGPAPRGGRVLGNANPVDGYGIALAEAHSQEMFSPNVYGDYIATSNDVYSAAMLRAKSLAKLNLRYLDKNKTALSDGGDIAYLLSHANPHWTFRRMLVQYELSMTIWGQCYWVIERSPSGKPRELWWVKPTLMKPVVDRKTYISSYLYTPMNGSPIRFSTDEVLWFRYPNIIDEFSGLAPMAAARLAADFASSAMHTNQRLFDQGLMLGGYLQPKDSEVILTEAQANDMETKLARRFTGVDKAHRWAVFRSQWDFTQMGISPADANFIEGINVSFRQVCRALGVPAPLLGDAEFATLANLEVYERQLWEHTMEFEASFFADELNEQLLPLFHGNAVKSIEFDLSNIAALQEDKETKEIRDAQQISDGRKTINEWRTENGYDPVSWGDVAWMPWNVVPVTSIEPKEKTSSSGATRAIRVVDPFVRDEASLTRIVERLMARQFDATISTVKRTVADAASAPFDLAKWVAEYERESRPALYAIIEHGVEIGAQQAGVPATLSPEATQLLREQADRFSLEFARRTNETLFNEIRDAVAAELAKGGTVDAVTARIRSVIGPDAAEWRARRIASTETTKASTYGQTTIWRETGVARKQWQTQGDAAVRDSHAAINGQTIGIDDAFLVGGCVADGPGLSGCPEEDINCRCRLVPIRSAASAVASLRAIELALGDTDDN